MGFFAKIMKAGMKHQADEERYVDVTSGLNINLPSDSFKAVDIDSALSMKISFKDDSVRLKVYLKNGGEKESVSIKTKVESDQLVITAKSLEDSINGYIKLSLPEVSLLKVNTEYGDISVKNTLAQRLVVQSYSGDISIEPNLINDAEISTESGDILLRVTSNDYRINPITHNGEVIWEGCENNNHSKKTIDCQTKNGDIQIMKVKR